MGNDESMYDEGDRHFEIEAGWERSGGEYRCRYCVISCLLNEDDYGRVAGIAAGYAGGGSFEVERFYLETNDKGEASKLIIESGFDAVTDPTREHDGEIDWYEDMDAEIQEAAEAAYALLFRWNDDDVWNDSDEIRLRAENESQPDLQADEDMLLLRTDDEPYPRWICQAIGLTGLPVFEEEE